MAEDDSTKLQSQVTVKNEVKEVALKPEPLMLKSD